jgi:hypothetical protein
LQHHNFCYVICWCWCPCLCYCHVSLLHQSQSLKVVQIQYPFSCLKNAVIIARLNL